MAKFKICEYSEERLYCLDKCDSCKIKKEYEVSKQLEEIQESSTTINIVEEVVE